MGIESDKKHCVYLHINKINGKVYVGQTRKQPKARWQNGTGYRTQHHFWSAICKYGWENFEHKIVATNLTGAEADTLEKRLIVEFETMNPDKGYNKESGGCGERYVSDETRKKISLSHMGEKNPMYGKSMSDANKKARSNRWKGLNNPNRGKTGADAHHKTPVCKVDKNTDEVICVYDTMAQAEEDTGAQHSNIVKCCIGERKTTAGYKWKYAV